MLGLVTIGQSPRRDVLEDIAHLLDGVEWVEHGALDGLTHDQVTTLGPDEDDDMLVSVLRDGSSVELGHDAVMPHVERAVADCVGDGAEEVLLMCSGNLPGLHSSVPLLAAETLAHAVLARRLSGRRVGVVVPVARQVRDAHARWAGALGREVSVAHADPYTDPRAVIIEAGAELARGGAEAIVLDCFGFTNDMAGAIHQRTGVDAEAVRMVAVEAALSRQNPAS